MNLTPEEQAESDALRSEMRAWVAAKKTKATQGGIEWLLDKDFLDISQVIGMLVGIVTFAGSWIYCIGKYGFFLGFGFGWVPSAIAATMSGWLTTLLLPKLLHFMILCSILLWAGTVAVLHLLFWITIWLGIAISVLLLGVKLLEVII